jgi:muramoyltetrapeptide carboxypeptidase
LSDSIAIATAKAPPRLRIGDQIGVIAPSGPPLAAPLKRGLEALATAFRVKVAHSAQKPSPPSYATYLAADDATRAREANEMFADPDVRAVIMARGGYGLLRILPLLDPRALRADPKPIIGFSDGTALLSWASAAGIRGIHGEVVVRMGDERPEAIGDLVRALTDPAPLGVLPWRLSSLSPAVATPTAVSGSMIVSNLVMACHLVGTPWQLPLADSIWWLEEVGERPYEIDRCLTHLSLTGQLPGVAGAVIGDLVRCMDPLPDPGTLDDPRGALAVLAERFGTHRVPILTGAQFGHGRFNRPLPFGARCTFDPGAAVIEILDGAVS